MSEMKPLAIDELQKIKWRCRRGMLELDLILGRFVNEHYPTLSDGQKEAFIALLGVEDPLLFAWLMGHEQPEEPHFQKIVEVINASTANPIS